MNGDIREEDVIVETNNNEIPRLHFNNQGL